MVVKYILDKTSLERLPLAAEAMFAKYADSSLVAPVAWCLNPSCTNFAVRKQVLKHGFTSAVV